MGKINSKSKGNKAERDAAKWWQEWTGYEFGRVPASGGLRWKKVENVTSDIICTHDKHSRRFPFSIEVKCYKDINFEHLLLGKKTSKIHKFWQQACRDSERANKLPCLMMRYNGMAKGEWFLCFEESLYELILDKFIKKNIANDVHTMMVTTPEIEGSENLCICMASEVLKHISYKEIYKVTRR